MGYDMHWSQVPETEAVKVGELRQVFDRAVEARDGKIKEFVEARVGREISFHDDRDLYWSEKNKLSEDENVIVNELQEVVTKAYDNMSDAENSYFRANIWGMGVLRTFMYGLGMFADVPGCVAGITQRGFQSLDGEWHSAERYDEETDEYVEDPEGSDVYNTALEGIKTLTLEEVHGIGYSKFSSNDGWWVTPIEIEAALQSLHAEIERPIENDVTVNGMSISEYFNEPQSDSVRKLVMVALASTKEDYARTSMFSNVHEPAEYDDAAIVARVMEVLKDAVMPSLEVPEGVIPDYLDYPEDERTDTEAVAIKVANNAIFFMRFICYMAQAHANGGFYVW